MKKNRAGLNNATEPPHLGQLEEATLSHAQRSAAHQVDACTADWFYIDGMAMNLYSGVVILTETIMKTILCALGLLCNVGVVNAMDIFMAPGKATLTMIGVNGPIVKGDAGRLEAAYANANPASKTSATALERTLVVDSDGGDLDEAMVIGRWARANQFTVVVRPDARCYSSCVFILAAGVLKFASGEVGIHRPYLVKRPAIGFDAAMKRALAASQAYFVQMNIPPQLADTMFSIPPAEMRLLDEDMLAFYRLNQADFAYSEEQEVRLAERYGMSRAQYQRNWSQFMLESKACKPKTGRAFYACRQTFLAKHGFAHQIKK